MAFLRLVVQPFEVAFPWDLAFPLVVFASLGLVVHPLPLGVLQLLVVVVPLVLVVVLVGLGVPLVVCCLVFFVIPCCRRCCGAWVAQVKVSDSREQILLVC
jgi:hypothetical protein